MEHLRGKTAVITGGASGIGLATARALGAQGTKLMIADVEESALNQSAGDLSDAGYEVEAVACDVGDLNSMALLAATAFQKWGAVHIVFHNAGVAVGGPVADMKHSDWEWTLRVNLWGPIHGVEVFTKRMIAGGAGGHMVFTASFAGLVPNIGLGPYCVSKYGVVALAEVLRRELRRHDIGVSVLCPMRVDTNIGLAGRNRPGVLGGPGASPGVPEQGPENDALAGRVLDAEGVAQSVIESIKMDRLYILPHEESRDAIRRRFERIDQAFGDFPPR